MSEICAFQDWGSARDQVDEQRTLAYTRMETYKSASDFAARIRRHRSPAKGRFHMLGSHAAVVESIEGE
jgi:hypothetical protein